MISDASKMIDVEPHVLRYWQEELGLDIPRNEMGHRHYRQEDIELLKSVKTLRDKGFQLKAIKLLIPKIHKVKELDAKRLSDLRDKLDVALGLVDVKDQESRVEQKSDDHELHEEEILEDELKNESQPDVESNPPSSLTELKEQKKDGKQEKSIPLQPKKDVVKDEIKRKEDREQEKSIKTLEAPPKEEGDSKYSEEKADIEEGVLDEKKEQEVQEALRQAKKKDSQGEQEVVSQTADIKPAETGLETVQESHELATDSQNQDKLMKFHQIMKEIMADAMKENREKLTQKMTMQMTDAITETMIKELDYHMRMREEREEERFKQLDRTIREFQQQRQQVAATKDTKKKESRFFKKNKKRI